MCHFNHGTDTLTVTSQLFMKKNKEKQNKPNYPNIKPSVYLHNEGSSMLIKTS